MIFNFNTNYNTRTPAGRDKSDEHANLHNSHGQIISTFFKTMDLLASPHVIASPRNIFPL